MSSLWTPKVTRSWLESGRTASLIFAYSDMLSIDVFNTLAALILVHDVLGLGYFVSPYKLPLTPICYTMGSCIAIKNFGWSVGAFGFMAGNVIFITAGLCASDLPMPSEICGLVEPSTCQ